MSDKIYAIRNGRIGVVKSHGNFRMDVTTTNDLGRAIDIANRELSIIKESIDEVSRLHKESSDIVSNFIKELENEK